MQRYGTFCAGSSNRRLRCAFSAAFSSTRIGGAPRLRSESLGGKGTLSLHQTTRADSAQPFDQGAGGGGAPACGGYHLHQPRPGAAHHAVRQHDRRQRGGRQRGEVHLRRLGNVEKYEEDRDSAVGASGSVNGPMRRTFLTMDDSSPSLAAPRTWWRVTSISTRTCSSSILFTKSGFALRCRNRMGENER